MGEESPLSSGVDGKISGLAGLPIIGQGMSQNLDPLAGRRLQN
jgi:hypothetical protein